MNPSRTHYIFVDYENVQDMDLQLIQGRAAVKVVLVMGEHRKNVPVELMEQVHKLSSQVELVRASGTGKNALDFVLACCVGRKEAADLEGIFHILAKDKGFDALVAHLKSRDVRAFRHEVFAKIPVLMDATKLSIKERVDMVKQRLCSMKKEAKDGRPRKEKKLCSMIASVFYPKLPPEEVAAVVEALKKDKALTISADGAVDY